MDGSIFCASARRRQQGEGSNLGLTPHHNYGSYCCYVINTYCRGDAMVPNWCTHYHTLSGLPDKGCAIKELDVCFVLFNLILRVFAQKRRVLHKFI